MRELRQGRGGAESALLDLAVSAERRGDLQAAEDLYRQALQRNPRSWRSARLLGEFYRHRRQNLSSALHMYEQAAANAPRAGADRALIYREWGMLLREAGTPDATDQAINKFEVALEESPNDVVAIHALAHMRSRKGQHYLVIDLLEPLMARGNEATRKKTAPILLKSYESLGEVVKGAELRSRIAREGLAQDLG